MSDNGIKHEDEHLRDRDEGGDDEVIDGFLSYVPFQFRSFNENFKSKD